MRRRTLTGLAALALCFFAPPARAQQPAPAPGVAPAELAPPAAPPADAPPLVAPVPLETPAPAPAPPAPFVVAAPASPAPPARVPIARRWWFWAGLGAAAVGLVVAAIALSPRQPYEGNASPGLVTPF